MKYESGKDIQAHLINSTDFKWMSIRNEEAIFQYFDTLLLKRLIMVWASVPSLFTRRPVGCAAFSITEFKLKVSDNSR